MNLSDTPSVSLSNVMSTVASYYGLNTGFTEREAETAGINIRNNVFLVSSLQGVGFFDVSSKPLTISNPARRPADLTYFTFRSVVAAATVDIRAPASSLSLEFSLRLPQSLSTSTSCSDVVIKPPSVPASVTTPP